MAGEEAKAISKQLAVSAPIEDVWTAWTTEAGTAAFFAPQAKIELHIDGPYELYFMPDAPAGSRGGEGCTLKDIQPPSRLVFTWNFPPSIPALRGSGALTRVTVTLRSLSDSETEVRLVQTGWKDGPAWEQGYAYFDRAWALVLDRLRRRFETGPIDWNNPDP
jgi:uncharacterized protein YndB with AHSA1/START domain